MTTLDEKIEKCLIESFSQWGEDFDFDAAKKEIKSILTSELDAILKEFPKIHSKKECSIVRCQCETAKHYIDLCRQVVEKHREKLKWFIWFVIDLINANAVIQERATKIFLGGLNVVLEEQGMVRVSQLVFAESL
jgi:hypothetical protein